MAKCVECGQDMDAGVQFCIRCGHPVQPAAAARGEKRVTVGDEGLFGKPPGRPPGNNVPPVAVVEVRPSGGGGRKTTFEEPDVGFGGQAVGLGAKASGFGANAGGFGASAGQASSAPGPRRTGLDEGPFGSGPAGAPRSPGPSPAMPAAAGGRPKTQLDEGPPRSVAPSVTRIVGWLVSFDFNQTGQAYDLRAGRTRVGSSRDNDISLFFDQKASGLHATLIWRDGKCAVKDDASTNGTKVNGNDIGIGAVQPLKTGDSLTIGGSTFLVFLIDPAESRELWPNLKV